MSRRRKPSADHDGGSPAELDFSAGAATEGKKKDENTPLVITEDVSKAMGFILAKMEKMQLDKAAINDDLEGVALKMGCSATEVREMLNLIKSEQKKGGVIYQKEKMIDGARQVLDNMDAFQSGADLVEQHAAE